MIVTARWPGRRRHPGKDALAVLNRVLGLFERLDVEAPAAVKPAMNRATEFYQQIASDFHHGSTVGQVDTYVRQHPPSTSGLASAERSLTHYITATCHIRR